MRSNVFQQIKDKADLADFIGTKQRDAKVFKTGNTTRVNPCPLCDSSDSFSIDDKTPELFHCFSCGEGGDIFNFTEKLERIDRGDSLKLLANHYNVDLDVKKASSKKKNQLQVVLTAALEHYKTCLQSDKKALSWLTDDKPQGRGHTGDTVKRIEVGLTDGNMADTLSQAGISLDSLKSAGLYVEDKKTPGKWKDFFCKGLIIFPHRLGNGDIAHFTIKDPNKKIDYQLRAENRLGDFYWSNQKAINRDEVFLVEGENDAASCFDISIYNVLAGLGQISDQQIRWLDTHGTGKHYHCWFDNDDKWGDNLKPPAGIKYTRRIYQRLLKNQDCTVDIISGLMAKGEDPDDFIQKDKITAKQRIDELLRNAQHPLVWEITVMPDAIRDNLESALRYLDDIDFFSNFGLVPTIKRAPIFKALEAMGFTREEIGSAIKEQRALRDMLDDIKQSADAAYQKSEPFQLAFAGYVWDFFMEHGKFFVSPGDKLHLFYKHIIYAIGDNIAWKALLNHEAGINAATPLSKYVNEQIKALCHTRGDRLDAFSWIHRDVKHEKTNLFFNLTDPLNRILKVQANTIELIDNGTNEDRILLSQSANIKPFEYKDTVDVPRAMDKVRQLLLNSMTCHPAQAYFVLVHALSSFLLPLSKSKVLLKLEGGSQSAKTSSARVCGTLLYGKDMVGRMTTASAYSMAGQEPWLIFDNIENQDITKDFLNFLLLVATGATNFKRTSGSDTGVTSEALNSLAVITGIEPFSKPELINRTFVIQFDRSVYGNIEFNEDVVGDEIVQGRNEMLSAWVWILAHKVLPNLSETGDILKYIRTQHNNHSKSRMDSHLSLLALVLRCVLEYIPLRGKLLEEAGSKKPEYFLLDNWLNYQNNQAREIESGTNSILQLLDGLRYVFIQAFQKFDTEYQGPKKIKSTVTPPLLQLEVTREQPASEDGQPVGPIAYSFESSTKQLLMLFQRYAKDQGIKMDFKTAMQLGVRIKNDMHVLKEAGWSFEYSRKVRGERFNKYQWES